MITTNTVVGVAAVAVASIWIWGRMTYIEKLLVTIAAGFVLYFYFAWA